MFNYKNGKIKELQKSFLKKIVKEKKKDFWKGKDFFTDNYNYYINTFRPKTIEEYEGIRNSEQHKKMINLKTLDCFVDFCSAYDTLKLETLDLIRFVVEITRGKWIKKEDQNLIERVSSTLSDQEYKSPFLKL